MSATFTPGPWVVRNGCNVFADAAHVPLTNAAYIACTGGLSGIDTIERDEANARLIAAAPELLDALIGVTPSPYLGESEIHKSYYAAARAAIAKARGGAA